MIKKIFIILLLILILSLALIISTGDYNLKTREGRAELTKDCAMLCKKIAMNSYSIVAYAVRLDWIPGIS